jgi:NAD(P)-dependent dehydrogenase (short-subunit alcohol dehydrogenase family)
MFLSPAAGKRNWTKPRLKSVPTSPGVQGDVANPSDLDRLYQTVAAKKGKLDVLFANAGVVEPVPTAAVTAEHYDKTFGINARGVYFTVQKALPLMKDGGSIIVNGSGASQKGIPIYSTYSATKAALRSFVRTWTSEFAGKGIRTNIINLAIVAIADTGFIFFVVVPGYTPVWPGIVGLGLWVLATIFSTIGLLTRTKGATRSLTLDNTKLIR